MPHLRAAYLLVAVLFAPICKSLEAQQARSGERQSVTSRLRAAKSDSTRVQLLLQLSEIYLKMTLNPVGNADSALMLANQAYDLANRLNFPPGKENATFLQGKIFIRQNNTVQVHAMLPHLSIANRIRLLLELGKSLLRTAYYRKTDPADAKAFFLKALKLSEASQNQKLKEESHCLIGTVYLLTGDWEQGRAHFMTAANARRQAGDTAGEINILLRMTTTVFCDDCSENIKALDRALMLSRQVSDKPLEALILLELGYKHLNAGNPRLAEQHAVAALNIQKETGFEAVSRACESLAAQSVYYSPSDYQYLSNAYYLWSDLSQVKGDLNRKLLYILEVVHSVEKSDAQEDLDYTYFRLGNAYWELGQYDKSQQFHRQSLSITNQKGNAMNVGLARRMTVALLKQGKVKEALSLLRGITDNGLLCSLEDKMYIAQALGSCYAFENYRRAEEFYLHSINWSKQMPLRFQFVAFHGISQFYIANAQFSKAEPFLKQLQNAPRQHILPNYLMEVHRMRFKVDSAHGKYLQAIRHYQEYKGLEDSIFNETKSRQIAQLSIQYETNKKEQDIQLQRKGIALLTEQNRSQKNLRNALIGGTGLLIAILLLGFNRYRLKQRVNRQLQSQQQVLQAQQEQIRQKNEHLSQLIAEKDLLLIQKDSLLEEKEWLLKEIHHRVKNNLQMVMSLLNSQANSLHDETALAAIHDSQHRVQAMSLIHQKLYETKGIARIHMSSYIAELVSYLHESYSHPHLVRVSLAVAPVQLDVTIAVPLGLIINEAITNALKYAFPNGRAGNIILKLQHVKTATYQLTIQDDGVGLPPGYDPSRSRSLGMTLIHGFSSQLAGDLTITGSGGVTITLIFSEEQISQIYTSTRNKAFVANN